MNDQVVTSGPEDRAITEMIIRMSVEAGLMSRKDGEAMIAINRTIDTVSLDLDKGEITMTPVSRDGVER